jgi:hypothetical protein
MRKLLAFFFVAALPACTHSTVSEVPFQLPDGTLAYRYQGRANFAHQMADADRTMAEHCQRVNGGRPVVVAAETRRIGTGGIAQGSVSSGFATGAFTTAANQNQELIYRCVPSS